ncbi:MAG: endonuclease domain-containing protein [bacterium]
MTKIYNRSRDREKRQILRKNMTEAEKILWEQIRKRKVNGHKFRRQYSIKGFVIDFYSPEVRLGIEIDGGYHLSRNQRNYDKARQKLIECLEINFIRFTNEEVFNNLEQVIASIRDKIDNSLYSSPYQGEDVPPKAGQMG